MTTPPDRLEADSIYSNTAATLIEQSHKYRLYAEQTSKLKNNLSIKSTEQGIMMVLQQTERILTLTVNKIIVNIPM